MNQNTSKAKVRKYASLACDGLVGEKELEELEALLLESPELIDDYASLVATDALVEIASGKNFLDHSISLDDADYCSASQKTSSASQQKAKALAAKNSKAASTSISTSKVKTKADTTSSAAKLFRSSTSLIKNLPLSSHLQKNFKHYALAATVLIGFFLWTVNRPYAQIVANEDVSWVEDSTYEVGNSIRGDWLEIDEGVVNLVFGKGAMASLQGPARFRATSSNNAYLEYGVLTIQAPESAQGFEVTTPALSVVDLGTGFRLQVEKAGSSSLHVTEGLVELSKLNDNETYQLAAGKIAIIDPMNEEITLALEPTLKSSRQVNFIEEHPASLAYGKYDHDDQIIVFMESYRKRLSKAIRVNLSKPGRHDWFEESSTRIESGEIVSSYLVHCAPFRKRHVVEGEVTFPGKILGVICNSDALNATNSTLGAGWTLQCAHPERGIESIPDRNSDVVTISRDRRTLSLSLKTESIDQLRVLVAEN